MVNDGEVGVYKRGICQNLHFDHRWYIFRGLNSIHFPLDPNTHRNRNHNYLVMDRNSRRRRLLFRVQKLENEQPVVN